MCHGVNKIQKKDWKIQDSESRNSEFRKLQNSESGNWTGKLQNSGNWISEFRKLQNLETSEFRIGKLDAIRYAIVFHWFWSVGLSPKTPQAD